MSRCATLALLFGLFFGSRALAQPPEPNDQSPEPTVFEVMINGETFVVEGNRVVSLESRKKPGTTYEVAVRVAPVQRLRLRNVQLDYGQTADVQKLSDGTQPSAKLGHELGFSMLVTDLGRELQPKAQREMLDLLVESVVQTYAQRGGVKIEATDPHEREFEHAEGLGVVVRYRDTDGFQQNALVYVLQGDGFAASAIVQYLEADKQTALPLIKRTLDSIRGT